MSETREDGGEKRCLVDYNIGRYRRIDREKIERTALVQEWLIGRTRDSE